MYKQVIVVRNDLKLDKGKLASQVAHASLEAYKKADKKSRILWEDEGSKKVVLKAEGLKSILELAEKAKSFGISCSIIKDAGKTQVEKGTITCLGIGPDKEEDIDKITRHLKLL